MKRILLVIITFFVVTAHAQQRPLITQYMFNDLVFNPAIAGVKDYVPLNFNVREQWTGINEAPSTQSISMHGFLDANLGAGAHIFNHVTGPLRRTGFTVSTAYHLKISKSRYSKVFKTLSFGLGGSLQQYVTDKSKIKTRIIDDPAINDIFNYKLVPDVSFGIYFHEGNKYYFGLSSLSLMQTHFDLFNNYEFNINEVVRNYYITGGGNIKFNQDFSLQPSFLGQMIESTPFQIEFSLVGYYKEKYFLGASYRNQDAVSGIVGYKNNAVRVGYSFDYTLSDIGSFSSGTHEVNITLFFLNGSLGGGKTYKGNKQRRSKSNYKPDIDVF